MLYHLSYVGLPLCVCLCFYFYCYGYCDPLNAWFLVCPVALALRSRSFCVLDGAGNGTRTRDPKLGRLVL